MAMCVLKLINKAKQIRSKLRKGIRSAGRIEIIWKSQLQGRVLSRTKSKNPWGGIGERLENKGVGRRRKKGSEPTLFLRKERNAKGGALGGGLERKKCLHQPDPGMGGISRNTGARHVNISDVRRTVLRSRILDNRMWSKGVPKTSDMRRRRT